MIGEKIHAYEINAHLGQGGMGNVYRATDIMLGREVALKMLHPQLTVQPQFLERFKKEARVLAQLLHPNIAVIYNFIEQGGNHFMVMEYVEGTNLDDLLKKYKKLPTEFIVPVFIQALEGLHHAHKKNIFHRDIKPSNIMLTPDGTVKLMHFGIAKIAGEQKMTQVNKIVGTVEFMAPELIQGKDASAASDIYAAGVTLYEMIAGKLPFAADTDFSLMQAILKEKIISPEKINSSIPKSLSGIVMKALDKKPENRYADAKAFQQALINAFPQYREINLAAITPATNYAASTRLASPLTQANTVALTAEATVTQGEVWPKPIVFVETAKQHVLQYKKYYLAALGLLLFLFISISLIKKKSADPGLVINDTAGQHENNQKQPESVIIPKDRRDAETIPEREKSPEKPIQKKAEKNNTERTKTIEQKPKEEKPIEEKPVSKHEVYIRSKVEVELYLENNLDDAPEREDIPVSFRVTNSVVYDGVTIINRGSAVSGTIKLGRILTDVNLGTVTAANGDRIKLKALKSHGRRNEITADRNYTAIILPGTRLTF